MIIVAGHLLVEPDERAAYVDGCLEVIAAARSAAGCLDFHISADPIDPARVNIFERWDSADAVDAFRGSGVSAEQQAVILHADVEQHEVAATTSLT